MDEYDNYDTQTHILLFFIASFLKLGHTFQQMLLDGLESDFNMAQFIQGENVPRSLEGVKLLVHNKVISTTRLYSDWDTTL